MREQLWGFGLEKCKKVRYSNSGSVVNNGVSLIASSSRKLTLLYVANDVIQNARRKGPEYKAEFTRALPRALHLVAK